MKTLTHTVFFSDTAAVEVTCEGNEVVAVNLLKTELWEKEGDLVACINKIDIKPFLPEWALQEVLLFMNGNNPS